jgi:hypothetical protein
MARSKSPAPKRERSSSRVAAKAAPAADSNELITAGVTFAVILVAWFLANRGSEFPGADPLGNFVKTAQHGFQIKYPWGDIPVISGLIGGSCNLVLLLHVLNSIDNSKTSGFWLNNFAQTYTTATAGVIISEIMSGKPIAGAIFGGFSGFSLPSFFFLWYLVTRDIPFCPVKFNWWGTVKKVGGEPLEMLLGFGTHMFTTSLVLSSLATSTVFSSKWFQVIATAVIIGTASEYLPSYKGFSFKKSEELTHSLAVAVFVASDGFKIIDFFVSSLVGIAGIAVPFEAGTFLNQYSVDFFGGTAGFVVFITLFNYISGGLCPSDLRSNGFDLLGLLEKTLSRCQLD